MERHDVPLSGDRKLLKRRLNQLGERLLRDLIDVHRADAMGKGTEVPETVDAWARSIHKALDALLAEQPCVTLKALAVKGSDLAAAGFPKGPLMGQCLGALLDRVIDETLPNERGALLDAAVRWLNEQH